MDFKKFKREVKKENISIPQMSEEVKLYSKEKNQFQEKRYFKNRNFNFKLSFSLITVLVIMFAIIIIGSPDNEILNGPALIENKSNTKNNAANIAHAAIRIISLFLMITSKNLLFHLKILLFV